MSALPARTGLEWLKQGFSLFRQQPGILTMLLFANLLFSLLIGNLPFIGPILAVILIPSFTIAIMQTCNLITQGERVTPEVLLTGFRPPALARLCKLGLVYIGLIVVLTVLMKFSVNDAFVRQMTMPVDPKAPPVFALSDMLSLLLVLVLQAVSFIALCFAAPLIYWKQMSTFKATFYSVFGVFGATRAMMLMLLTWFGTLLLACLVVVLILSSNITLARVVVGWISLLFVLVLQCAIYASYRQIFADPAPAVEQTPPHAD